MHDLREPVFYHHTRPSNSGPSVPEALSPRRPDSAAQSVPQAVSPGQLCLLSFPIGTATFVRRPLDLSTRQLLGLLGYLAVVGSLRPHYLASHLRPGHDMLSLTTSMPWAD